ncbi:MAG: tripartite tricarboxylate transporter substrate binding protein [Betaproteobacteria bacterium]|nr:tripartite tricarboxylate transporter substrate binding protein [Betaproteobacteria bacterium]
MTTLRIASLMAAAVLGCAAAYAQTYPAKPIRVIVPFGTGGPADIYARFLGQHMQGPLGQPWVVDARPGAGSIIGTEIVAKSPPDGYTLLVMSNTHTVNESLVSRKPFVLMRDFVAVAPINYSDLLLVVHPSVPAKSVKELVALARKAKGGMNYSSSGTGTPYHMAGELFKALAGVDILHVPHKSSGDARTSVMSGQTEMMLDAITTMLPIAKGGKVRALATSGRTRSAVAPDLPTIAEAGVKGYETTIWIGVMAPAGTPGAIVERLNAEITKVTNRSDVREVRAKQGATPFRMSVAEYEKYLHGDIAKWAKIVKFAGARTDR